MASWVLCEVEGAVNIGEWGELKFSLNSFNLSALDDVFKALTGPVLSGRKLTSICATSGFRALDTME